VKSTWKPNGGKRAAGDYCVEATGGTPVHLGAETMDHAKRCFHKTNPLLRDVEVMVADGSIAM
jgi:hypothetical protein